MLEQRLDQPVGHALPRQRDLRRALREPAPDEEAEQGAGSDRGRQQRARRQHLAELQVGHVAAHLDGADRAIDHQQVPDEPGTGDGDARQLEDGAQEVPVGEERDGGRRELGGPPAVRQQAGGPAPAEEQQDETGHQHGEPAPVTGHGVTR